MFDETTGSSASSKYSELPLVQKIIDWRGGVGEASLFHLPVDTKLEVDSFLGCHLPSFFFPLRPELPCGHVRHRMKLFFAC